MKTQFLALSVMSVALLAACGKKEEAAPAAAAPAAAPAAPAAPTVIKIGHVAPTSGSIAHLGKDNENGARMAIEELNAKGLTIGGVKVTFELLAEDDAGDPKQGTAAAQKLVDSKVHGVIGHLNSGTTIPASKIYSDAGIAQISALGHQPEVHPPGLQDHLPRRG
jgi:branched-chain amino acid transport system substrate-binding protein